MSIETRATRKAYQCAFEDFLHSNAQSSDVVVMEDAKHGSVLFATPNNGTRENKYRLRSGRIIERSIDGLWMEIERIG
jgi:hypothetical protein